MRKFAKFAAACAVACVCGAEAAVPNEWTVEPSLVRQTVKAGQVPQVAGTPRYGTISLTYDNARTAELPTEVGWHTVHVGVEPTDEADGLKSVDFSFFVRFAWAEENVGEAFVELPPNPKSVTMTGYPVMLRLSTNTLAGVDMTTMADGGADLRFYDAAGNELAHDVETFNRNGDSFVWVKIPSYGPEKQGLVMNWGKTKARTTTDAAFLHAATRSTVARSGIMRRLLFQTGMCVFRRTAECQRLSITRTSVLARFRSVSLPATTLTNSASAGRHRPTTGSRPTTIRRRRSRSAPTV